MFTKEQTKILVLIGVILVIGSSVSLYRHFKVELPEAMLSEAFQGQNDQATRNVHKIIRPPVLVHVAGAVAHPGVYRVSAACHVMDVLKMAGGVVPNADLNGVNLVGKIKDGLRIKVPYQKKRKRRRISATKGTPQKSSALFPVNINTASQRILESIPGIGAVTARNIVKYRAQHGRFENEKDLVKVNGIGESTCQKLMAHIVFSH